MVASFSVLLWCCCISVVFSAAETANRIVAIVNGEVITEADVMSRVTALLDAQQAPAATADTAGHMKEAVLQRLIEQRLMLQEAKRLGVAVDDEAVAKRLADLKQAIGSEETFQQFLTEEGLDEVQLKEHITDQLLIDGAISREVRSKISISPQEVAPNASEPPAPTASNPVSMKVSCLLIRVNEQRSEAAAKALIGGIQQQVSQGADFAELAKRSSEDAYAAEGGLMGWVEPGRLLPQLEEALKHLTPGETSPPIRTSLGLHLVKVHEVGAAGGDGAQAQREAAYQRVYRQKFQDVFSRWIAELKRKAYIEILGAEG